MEEGFLLPSSLERPGPAARGTAPARSAGKALCDEGRRFSSSTFASSTDALERIVHEGAQFSRFPANAHTARGATLSARGSPSLEACLPRDLIMDVDSHEHHNPSQPPSHAPHSSPFYTQAPTCYPRQPPAEPRLPSMAQSGPPSTHSGHPNTGTDLSGLGTSTAAPGVLHHRPDTPDQSSPRTFESAPWNLEVRSSDKTVQEPPSEADRSTPVAPMSPRHPEPCDIKNWTSATCPVCTDTTYDPSTPAAPNAPLLLRCGHNVSRAALDASSSTTCPICNNQWLRGAPTDPLRFCMATFLSRLPDEFYSSACEHRIPQMPLQLISALGEASNDAASAVTWPNVRGSPDLICKQQRLVGEEEEQQRAAIWGAVVHSVLCTHTPTPVPGMLWWCCTPRMVVTVMHKATCSLDVHVTKARQARLLQQGADTKQSSAAGRKASSAMDRHGGGLTLDEVSRITYRLASALAAVHNLPMGTSDQEVCAVVHCAVQPRHILLDEASGEVVLCSWGASAALRVDGGVVQPAAPQEISEFIAPELLQEEAEGEGGTGISEKADVWGLAATVYFMYTGKLPYIGEKRLKNRIRAILAGKHPFEPAPSLHPQLDGLLHRCLSKEPTKRPSMAEMAAAFSGLAGEVLMAQLRIVNDERRHLNARLKSLQQKNTELNRAFQQLQTKHMKERPTLPIDVTVRLEDLCAYATSMHEQGHMAELALGSRCLAPLPRTEGVTGTDKTTFVLAANVTGGSFHLQGGMVLELHGQIVKDLVVIGIAGVATGVASSSAGGVNVSAAESPLSEKVSVAAGLPGVAGSAGAVSPRSASSVGVDPVGGGASEDLPVVVLARQGMKVSGLKAVGCRVRVTAMGVQLVGASVEQCGACAAYEVASSAADALAPGTHGEQTLLQACEAREAGTGLKVVGWPAQLPLTVVNCKFHLSRLHNVHLAKMGSRGSCVTMHGVTSSGAVRSGFFVETACALHAVACTVCTNQHYGVQTMPKAEARLEACVVHSNKRGDFSGTGIQVQAHAAPVGVLTDL